MSNDGSVDAHSATDGRRRVARDEYGWVKGVRWAIGNRGGYCRDDSHAPTDYLGPTPVAPEDGPEKAPREVRTCGICAPRGAILPTPGIHRPALESEEAKRSRGRRPKTLPGWMDWGAGGTRRQ